jgi:hypothetical protein
MNPTPPDKELEAAKIAPVQGYSAGIPWDMHLRAYDAYCKRYSPQKALIEGWCRGGFAVEELDVFIPGWREELDEQTKLKAALTAEREAHAKTREEYEALLSKGAEAIGCVRWAAICLGISGPQWSEEPGFSQPVTNALLKQSAKITALTEALEKAGVVLAMCPARPQPGRWHQIFVDEYVKPAIEKLHAALHPQPDRSESEGKAL